VPSILCPFSSFFLFFSSDLDAIVRGTARVKANTIYQEIVADRGHVHMNSTIWTTLSGFVQYLGRTNKAVVEETPKGWFITYINRDPALLARQVKSLEHKLSLALCTLPHLCSFLFFFLYRVRGLRWWLIAHTALRLD
jgi:hypothetical protein